MCREHLLIDACYQSCSSSSYQYIVFVILLLKLLMIVNGQLTSICLVQLVIEGKFFSRRIMDNPSPSGNASVGYSGKKQADLIWLSILAGCYPDLQYLCKPAYLIIIMWLSQLGSPWRNVLNFCPLIHPFGFVSNAGWTLLRLVKFIGKPNCS